MPRPTGCSPCVLVSSSIKDSAVCGKHAIFSVPTTKSAALVGHANVNVAVIKKAKKYFSYRTPVKIIKFNTFSLKIFSERRVAK